jgi:hypothetical protein
MNRRQVLVLAVGVAALLGMAAYCPWYVKEPLMPGPPVVTPDGAVIGGVADDRVATVYRWAWDPPVPGLQPATVRVDWVRLLFQAAGVAAVTAGGVLLLRPSRNTAAPDPVR